MKHPIRMMSYSSNYVLDSIAAVLRSGLNVLRNARINWPRSLSLVHRAFAGMSRFVTSYAESFAHWREPSEGTPFFPLTLSSSRQVSSLFLSMIGPNRFISTLFVSPEELIFRHPSLPSLGVPHGSLVCICSSTSLPFYISL